MRSSDDDDDGFSDEFMMNVYKIEMCVLGCRWNKWAMCPFAHFGEAARRRNHKLCHYKSERCLHFWRNGYCPDMAMCELAHGDYEVFFHPQLYRTFRCPRDNCTTRYCHLAHNDEQDRSAQVESMKPYHLHLMQLQRHHRFLRQQFFNQPRFCNSDSHVLGSSNQEHTSTVDHSLQPVMVMPRPRLIGPFVMPTHAQMAANIDGVHHHHHHYHQFEAAPPPNEEHTVDHSLQPVQTMSRPRLVDPIARRTQAQMTANNIGEAASPLIQEQMTANIGEAASPLIQAQMTAIIGEAVSPSIQARMTANIGESASPPIQAQMSTANIGEAASPPIQEHTVDHSLQPAQTMPRPSFGPIARPTQAQMTANIGEASSPPIQAHTVDNSMQPVQAIPRPRLGPIARPTRAPDDCQH